jgi:hypothetical protein
MVTSILTVALFALAGFQQPAATAKPDPRANLDTTIALGIKLLEQKDYKTFLTTFPRPERLAERRDTIEEFVASFAKGNADRLLGALKQIQSMKPTMNADGSMATYTFDPPPETGPRTLRWVKVNGVWYIDN